MTGDFCKVHCAYALAVLTWLAIKCFWSKSRNRCSRTLKFAALLDSAVTLTVQIPCFWSSRWFENYTISRKSSGHISRFRPRMTRRLACSSRTWTKSKSMKSIVCNIFLTAVMHKLAMIQAIFLVTPFLQLVNPKKVSKRPVADANYTSLVSNFSRLIAWLSRWPSLSMNLKTVLLVKHCSFKVVLSELCLSQSS